MAATNVNQKSAAPAYDVVSITPADGSDVAISLRGFMVTIAGNVQINTLAGTTVVIPVNANTIYPIGVTRVWSTNTTATGILGLI